MYMYVYGNFLIAPSTTNPPLSHSICVVGTGAIELSIFSEHFKVEIAVVDIQTQRIDLFG